MGQSAEELRRDIARTREDLGSTLEAIGDRVSPSRIVERRTNRMRERVTTIRETVMGRAGDVGSSVTGRASTLSSGVSGATGSVTGHASDAVDAVRQAPDSVRRQAEGNPFAAGLVAFGAGLLAAAVFPATKPEQQAAQAIVEKAQPLKDEAGRVGQEIAANLKESGQQAAEQVKETGQQAAEQVKETASSAAGQTKEAAQTAASEVRSTTGGDTPPKTGSL